MTLPFLPAITLPQKLLHFCWPDYISFQWTFRKEPCKNGLHSLSYYWHVPACYAWQARDCFSNGQGMFILLEKTDSPFLQSPAAPLLFVCSSGPLQHKGQLESCKYFRWLLNNSLSREKRGKSSSLSSTALKMQLIVLLSCCARPRPPTDHFLWSPIFYAPLLCCVWI